MLLYHFSSQPLSHYTTFAVKSLPSCLCVSVRQYHIDTLNFLHAYFSAFPPSLISGVIASKTPSFSIFYSSVLQGWRLLLVQLKRPRYKTNFCLHIVIRIALTQFAFVDAVCNLWHNAHKSSSSSLHMTLSEFEVSCTFFSNGHWSQNVM